LRANLEFSISICREEIGRTKLERSCTDLCLDPSWGLLLNEELGADLKLVATPCLKQECGPELECSFPKPLPSTWCGILFNEELLPHLNFTTIPGGQEVHLTKLEGPLTKGLGWCQVGWRLLHEELSGDLELTFIPMLE